MFGFEHISWSSISESLDWETMEVWLKRATCFCGACLVCVALMAKVDHDFGRLPKAIDPEGAKVGLTIPTSQSNYDYQGYAAQVAKDVVLVNDSEYEEVSSLF